MSARRFVVVAAVLALGVALFFPLLVSSTGHPPADYCLHNIRMLGLSLIQYAVDHEGRLPDSFGDLLKQGYLTTTRCFICPSSSAKVPADFPWDYKSADVKVLSTADNWSSYAIVKGVTLEGKLKLVILYEKTPAHLYREVRHLASSWWGRRFGKFPDDTPGRFCAFSDGHVEWLPEAKFQERMKKQRPR